LPSSLTGFLTSPYSVNSSVNYQLAGFELGKWLADELGGKGNVMVVSGIPGTSASNSQDRGVKAGLATAPGIKIVGDVAGMCMTWLATASQIRLSTSNGGSRSTS
jgi:ribose transport system substrate-binding protein